MSPNENAAGALNIKRVQDNVAVAAEYATGRDLGVPVFAETCPHYLFFDDSAYDSEDFELARYVMSPPLRSKESQKSLWTALRTDDLQLVSTDHCPFCMKEGHMGRFNQKPLGLNDFSKIPNGVPGVETRMATLFDGGVRAGRISLNRFVELFGRVCLVQPSICSIRASACKRFLVR